MRIGTRHICQNQCIGENLKTHTQNSFCLCVCPELEIFNLTNSLKSPLFQYEGFIPTDWAC